MIIPGASVIFLGGQQHLPYPRRKIILLESLSTENCEMTLEKCDILTIKSYASAIRVGSLPKHSGKFTENGEL